MISYFILACQQGNWIFDRTPTGYLETSNTPRISYILLSAILGHQLFWVNYYK